MPRNVLRTLAVSTVFALLAIVATPSMAAATTVSVIVELDSAPAAIGAAQAAQAGEPWTEADLEARRAQLTAEQDTFLAALDAAGIAHTVRTSAVTDPAGATVGVPHRWSLVYNGMALSVAPESVAAIEGIAGVAAVHPDPVLKPSLDHSVAYTRASEVYGQVAELSPWDDLREGLEGQGVIVSVIDTGIDWAHEMFGADPSPPRFGTNPPTAAANNNSKVIYYLPLAGAVDDYGHGTHVAATAAGYLGYAPGPDGVPLTGDDVPVHGMAPQARLMSYKVCDGAGNCLGSNTITALEDSVSPRTVNGFPKPVAHVINLSLGGPGGPDSATAVASDNASLAGAVVVAAAGNDGPGERTLGSPAAGRRVIATAASNDSGVFPHRVDVLTTDGAGLEPGLGPIRATFAPDSNATQEPGAPIDGRYVFAGFADTPEQVPVTVAGRICLVERGSTATVAGQGTGLFGGKAANCQAKGAIAVLVFNNEPGDIGGVLAPAAIPVYTIARDSGLLLRDGLGFDAAGVSLHPIRLGLRSPALFEATITGFSSRGPVKGLGQIKPDLAAPGAEVLAATTKTGAPAATMTDPTGYTAANGTSMASPHAAGAAALVVQAHPGWSPDYVRAAMVNTATNPRDAAGVPQADGPGTDDILSQGGGLIDVAEAVDTRALLGVAGDGIAEPSILAGHSFGEVPVIDSRVSHTETVTLTLLDVSGEGGTYALSVANNRGFELDGISGATRPASVTLPAGGSATFELDVTIDGDLVRDALQVQGFVVAERTDGAESLRMPFYLKAIRSLPVTAVETLTEVYEDIVPAGDTGLGAAEGVTYIDIEFEPAHAAFSVDALLEFTNVAGLPDLDLELLDPQGEVIASSGNAGGPESLTGQIVNLGTYTYRVIGWANGPTPFTLTSTQQLGGDPPTLLPVATELTGSDGSAIDFDGAYALEWQPAGGEVAFEVEESTDGGESWQAIASVGGSTTSYAVSGRADGTYGYRVRGLFPGQIGYYVTIPSAEQSVTVDSRSQVKITNKVSTAISNVSFSGGVFAFDLALTSQASETYVPFVELKIVKVKSASGTVEVANADNGGSGRSKSDAALFDYSDQLGGDDELSPGETTGARHLEFADQAAEMFTFKAVVTAYRRTGSGAGTASASGAETGAAADEGDPSLLDGVTTLLEFTANPLTGTVIVVEVDEPIL